MVSCYKLYRFSNLEVIYVFTVFPFVTKSEIAKQLISDYRGKKPRTL